MIPKEHALDYKVAWENLCKKMEPGETLKICPGCTTQNQSYSGSDWVSCHLCSLQFCSLCDSSVKDGVEGGIDSDSIYCVSFIVMIVKIHRVILNWSAIRLLWNVIFLGYMDFK